MPYIRLIHEDEAEGQLKEIYAKRADKGGKVAGVTRAGCWNPPALAARGAIFQALMYRREGLARAEREFIAVVTSFTNRCEY